MEALTEWLKEKIGELLPDDFTLVDVGAFRGDFTQAMLDAGRVNRAILFEANPRNSETLRSRFGTDPRITIVNQAAGAAAGEVPFYCGDDPATGSVLPYEGDAEPRGATPFCETVIQTTLDRYLESVIAPSPIRLIKIDCQGYDLEVLKGAEYLIRSHHPWLVVELNFVPLYKGQCAPEAILSWLVARDTSWQASSGSTTATTAGSRSPTLYLFPPQRARRSRRLFGCRFQTLPLTGSCECFERPARNVSS